MASYGAEVMSAAHVEVVDASGDTSSTNMSRECNAIYVGGAGNVAVVLPSGVAITFVGVPAGSILPVRAIRVNSTNTTATSMLALMTKSS